MKQKRLISILTMLTMLIALFPCMQVSAYDATARYRLVTSAEDIVPGAKYIIVGCPGYDTDECEYYALSDEESTTFEMSDGKRAGVALKKNDDGTLSLPSDYSGKIYPLVIKPINFGLGQYRFQIEDGLYLNAFYKTYEFDHRYSKSLPLGGTSGVSTWEPILRPDGTMLFKTGKAFASSNYETTVYSYIRMYHSISGDMAIPVFSGGFLNDSDIDLDGTDLTTDTLTEENIPVKTYLYKEVCTHSEENLTFVPAKASTCSENGNIAHYTCSNCCGYLDENKNEIKLSDTVLPLAPHTNTTFAPAKEATCTENGNIAYTHCNDCGKYFEGNATAKEIAEKDIHILSTYHSYTDGVCTVCGARAEQAYFSPYGTTGDGYRYIFVAEYDGKYYAMGRPNEKGMTAAEITKNTVGNFFASSETAAFTEEVSYGSTEQCVDSSTNYTPVYVKIGENYLKNDSLTLTLDCNKDTATYWRSRWGYIGSDYVNYLADNPNDNAQICLVTDDGDPYFSLCTSTNETHIAAFRCGEQCHHSESFIHTEAVEPTCIQDGNIEYWYCETCMQYYADEEGTNVIEKSDVMWVSQGPNDENDDGLCDYCGKSMPVYKKVTDASDIVAGGKYLLITQMDENCYVMKALPKADTETDTIAAASITPQADGTIQYMDAKDKKAMMFKLKFIADMTDWSDGGIRYGMHYAYGNKEYLLNCYGGEFTSDYFEYAKYGCRIGLNEDGSAKILSAYDEWWNKEDTESLIYFRAYRTGNSHFFSMKPKDAYTEVYSTVREFPVYLYRLVESGTVGDISYTLSDSKTSANYTNTNDTVAQSNGVEATAVCGVAEAMTQESINSYVSQLAPQENAVLNTKVDISVNSYSESSGKNDGAISFSMNPVIYDSVNPENKISVTDSSFSGFPITVTLYTGGINPQQIVHIKQDGTKEYFYNEYSVEAMENGEKAFSSGYDNDGNMFVSFDITEFSDIVLLETPESNNFTISDFDEKMQTVNIYCPKAGTYTVIFADYDEKTGALNDARTITQEFKAETNSVSVPKEIYLSYGDKIMLWSNFTLLTPLSDKYEITYK